MCRTVLNMQDLTVAYQGKPVVKDINLIVKEQEIVCVVGESGSGKSTLLKASMRLLGQGGTVSKGSIHFWEQDLLGMSQEQLRKIRGAEMGTIFQNCKDSLCPVRTIGEQLYECVTQHGKISRKIVEEKAVKLLEKLHLTEEKRILESYPFELSGGMNQRVGIMMALIMQPSLLLADEPTSSLDVTVQADVVKAMTQMRNETGTAILMVTHNMGVAAHMADRIVVMKEGQIVELGNTKEILSHPAKEYTRNLIRAVPRLNRR